MTKPAIILVHGFWGGAAHWTKVILELAKQGYSDLHAVEMPLTSLADDVERLRKMIAQQQGNVLLVGHSYGGAVITEAGNMPNVVGLVYIAAFAPDAGESPGGITQAHPPAAIANVVPDSDGYLWVKPGDYRNSFCQDLTEEEALVMAITQKAPLGTTFGDTITAPAWRQRPSWYQISSQDRMIDPENQKMMSGRMKAKKIVTLDASHASLASRPTDVAALIDEAARSVALS
ncbi:alpha/beta hydrolase [Agrobacterium rhizogenes]|uniref:AB hydrolase-1 domain-containing protein n=1 Tax=Rhizobium rhizogenes NBRC 13257 TaxID=1220581 RepID=A0AA87UCM0_RHIRH|nr:alpha/beta hydrolase [Rhizobium rhizogenes]NTF52773.1 alpha/beta hydrolase [Rhizobium rhizogenes]NTF59292.1 alpha/beta hydrolase [Rhizobium rhizogenes]NTF65983.1 alpha/beta hydrolase [Rhizobium rhizogenes]NTF78876.1 alpha/beta hydrolase [Rhizobium rhizogenes]NTF98094.1 alpha/beta hydrolase [Rhizobium rhizogenes]